MRGVSQPVLRAATRLVGLGSMLAVEEERRERAGVCVLVWGAAVLGVWVLYDQREITGGDVAGLW
jgi:hypothetical protein